jgi:hypothetical protein
MDSVITHQLDICHFSISQSSQQPLRGRHWLAALQILLLLRHWQHFP